MAQDTARLPHPQMERSQRVALIRAKEIEHVAADARVAREERYREGLSRPRRDTPSTGQRVLHRLREGRPEESTLPQLIIERTGDHPAIDDVDGRDISTLIPDSSPNFVTAG